MAPRRHPYRVGLILVVLGVLLTSSAGFHSQEKARPMLAAPTPLRDALEGLSSPALGPLSLHTVALSHPRGAALYGEGWLDYNPVDHDLWIVGTGGYVEVYDWTNRTTVATIGVGTSPFGIAVDPADNEVYVANSGSNNVSVISGATLTVIASVSVGLDPLGVAYDAADHRIYVANNGSDNVSVISPSTHTVVAGVPVGIAPLGVAADPVHHRIFVANHGSNNVSVISANSSRVVATLPAGSGPYGEALDNATGDLYVTNEGSNNVTVINTTRLAVTAAIPVIAQGVDLQGIAYNPIDQRMWAAAGRDLIAALNTTQPTVDGFFGTDPAGVAYNPDVSGVCVTNTANVSFACIGRSWPLYAASWDQFTAYGLPNGASWAVTVNSSALTVAPTTQWGNGTTISFQVPSVLWVIGSLDYTITPPAGYAAIPAQGSIWAGGNALQNITLVPLAAPYTVTFLAFGLSPGESWGITLGAATANTTASSLVFSVPNGSYPFVVQAPFGLTASPANGSVVVNGGNLTVPISFGPASHYTVTFHETGLPNGTAWTVYLYSVGRSSLGPDITFSQVNGTYPFSVLSASGYSPTPAGGYVTVAGGSQVVPVTFATTQSGLWFNETGLSSGLTWGVTLVGTGAYSGSVTNTTAAASLRFTVPIGLTGTYSVLAPSGSTVSPSNGSLALPTSGAPVTVQLTFSSPGSLGPPPRILAFTISPTNGSVGSPVEIWLNYTGGTAPVTRSYSGLPPGCYSGNDSPLFCWPGAPGSYAITGTVIDANGRSATAEGVLNVAPVLPFIPPAPFVSPWPVVLWAGIVLAVVMFIVLAVVLIERELRPRPPPPYRRY